MTSTGTATQLDIFTDHNATSSSSSRSRGVGVAVTERPTFDLTDAITDLMTADPSHDRDRAAVVEAIHADAASHNGQVDPNRVRQQIPAWVYPRVIGATYRVLISQGSLVRDGWTTSTDSKGRNGGKPAPLYRWVGR